MMSLINHTANGANRMENDHFRIRRILREIEEERKKGEESSCHSVTVM